MNVEAPGKPIPLDASDLHRFLPTFVREMASMEVVVNPVGCRPLENRTVCRYHLGETGIISMISSEDQAGTDEIALSSSVSNENRAEIYKTVFHSLIIAANPDMDADQRSAATKELVRKFETASLNPRSPQQVQFRIGRTMAILYQDSRGGMNLNLKAR